MIQANPIVHRQGARWLITFADLIAVMVAFFVLVFAMSEVDAGKWQNTVNALNKQFEAAQPPLERPQESELNAEMAPEEDTTTLAYLARLLERRTLPGTVLQDALVELRSDRLVISLPSFVLFQIGRADLSTNGKSALFALSSYVANLKHSVEIGAHVAPQASAPPGSEWVLSLARALIIAENFKAAGYVRPMVVLGHGSGKSGRPDPGPRGARRNAMPQYVEIVIWVGDEQ